MGWMGRIGIGLLVVVAGLAAAYWYYVADGAVPSTATYKTDIAGWRALIAADTAALPSEIRVEIVGRDTVPLAAMQAGAPFAGYRRVRASFQLNGPSGSVIIDTAMDKEIAAKAQQGPAATFDEAAYGRVIAAMGNSSRVAVTHEHPDHIGGVAKFPVPERLAERLTLSSRQQAGLRAFAPDAASALASADIRGLDYPERIAPGVVMIPAEGHTPGSVMFFVKLADGREALFIGDIAWVLSNVSDLATRPRFVQQFYMVSAEDRAAVADQIRALHDLKAQEPALAIIPAHDAPVIEGLVASGLLKTTFKVEAP
jgi:glyoxylase-like metal-dependent hydrolase (beta-lactamase superfamily II)